MDRAVSRNIQGIVFDCDGVIAETEDLHRQAYNRMFQEEGLDLSWSMEQYRRELAELGLTKLMRLGRERGIDKPESFAIRLKQRKRVILKEIIRERVKNKELTARPGVARLVREALDAGVKIGAASITNKSAVEAIIEGVLGTALLSQFEFIATSDFVQNQKPAPDIYILAVNKLGVEASKSVAIEDSVHGMQAAIRAGLKCVVTPCDYTQNDNFNGADLVVPDLGEPGQKHRVDIKLLDELCSGDSAK